jgi:hypothetical protein
MKKWIFTGLVLIVLTTCFASAKEKKQPKPQSPKVKYPLLLTVDFNTAAPLKYKFVSERHMTVNFDPTGKYSRTGTGGDPDKNEVYAEKLEMDITYKALKVEASGYSTIEATCDSVKVTGNTEGHSRKDAVESLAGRSFTFKVTPTGKIADDSNFVLLVKALGAKAFTGEGQKGKIKDPDMIMDFVATQWRIWDSTASIKKPLKGVKKDSTWNSQLLVPMPFVSKTGRDVVYKLAGVVESNNVSYADITSTYSLSKTPPADAPMPYGGSFQMRGLFGFLQAYKVLSIDGTGKQLFDIKKGLIKSDIQHYKTEVSASIFGLGSDTVEPNIKIDQTTTMTLVE